PPGIHFHTARRPPAVHQLHQGRTGSSAAARSQGVSAGTSRSRRRGGQVARLARRLKKDALMKLCGVDIGLDQPFFLIAGPCVIESREMAFDTAAALNELTNELGVHFIYKSSFDKADRSSGRSYRGPGQDGGLRLRAEVREHVVVAGPTAVDY